MLKKIQLLSSLLLIIFWLCDVLIVRAEDTNTTMSYQSGGGTPVSPLDPLLPDPLKPVKPIDPTDPMGPTPGTKGSLSLDFASSFQFGQQGIGTTDATYHAIAQKYIDNDGKTKEGPNYIQVTDVRGTAAGWSLSVKQSLQFQTPEGQLLKGAELSFKNGELVSNIPASYAPLCKQSFALPVNQEVTVVTANKEQGIGTWVYRFGSNEKNAVESINLTVPGKAVKYAKSYETRLTWSLKNVP